MKPCEHGAYDHDACPGCLQKLLALRTSERDSAQQTVEHLEGQINAAFDVMETSLRSSGILDAVKQRMQAYLCEKANADSFEAEVATLRAVAALAAETLNNQKPNVEWARNVALVERASCGQLTPNDLNTIAAFVAARSQQ